MNNRLLYAYHARKHRNEESRAFRLFLLAQFMHYGALLTLFLGGLFLIVVAIKILC